MPNDITDIFPLKVEGPDAILGRMQIDVNAGIDPADPLYADILPGSVWDDLARADSLEMDRLYDRMYTEVPAAALPAFATGDMLDQWAAAVELDRLPATAASGEAEFAGPDGTEIDAGTQVSTVAPTPDSDPITYQTTESGVIAAGSFTASIVAMEEGSAGNVAANTVTQLDTPIDGVTVTNINGITSGSDVETDERLQSRVLRKLRGINGAGNVDYYINLALNYPGVGYVTVLANTPSVGHVTVMILDVDRNPASAALIAGLQEQLDPSATAGQGAGLAAPGATVIVSTPTAQNVALAATIVPESGYSLAGGGGLQALEPGLTAAAVRYWDTLGSGDDVIYNQALAALMNVEGVKNVSALTLAGVAADFAIAADHIAVLPLPPTFS